ncbi:MAG: SusC/RagA family TonB-linked outer membrane protein, partial [Bacteroidota bacterium]
MKLLNWKSLALLAIFSLFANVAWSQVSGTVTDEDGIGLPGVNIIVVGSSSGTVTDLDGAYTINAPSDATLRFSYLGFVTQEIAIAGRSTVDVKLGADATALQEVVVLGYGTSDPKAVTGAISSIGTEEVAALTVTNLGEALQGRLAGVQVTAGGAPGVAPLIQVRGIGSISFGSGPLYVVDGIPGAGGLNQFDTRDIESVTVLKDASSTAVYGSRASNGVILIETKKGGGDGIKANLHSTVGIQTQTRRFDVMNTEQYVNYAEALAGMPLARDLNATVNDGSGRTYRQVDTDWQDAIFQDGFITQNQLSLSGGSDASSFYSSLGYLKQEGVMIGTPYERFNFRINSEHKIGGSDRLRIGQTLLAVNDERFREAGLGGRTQLLQAIQSIPYQPIFDNTNIGGFSGADQGQDSADPGNPVLAANLFQNVDRVFKLLGTVYAEYDIIEGLTARVMYGANFNNFRGDSRNPIYESTVPSVFNSIGSTRSNTYSPLYNGQLTYNNVLGDHSINATVVAEVQETFNRTVSASADQTTNSINVISGG